MTTVKAEKTAIHSNAFNFQSFVQSGVDPRTGLYTVSLSLHEVEANDLRGPAVPLKLNYNPINTTDKGYGVGWGLALTQYTPATQIVSVYSGETFKVTGDYRDENDPTRLKMKEQKIQSFKLYTLTNDPRGEYQVVHKSGLVEILKLMGASPQSAMPVKMYSPQGHEVTLTYDNGGQGLMVSSIRDSQGTLLDVIRNLVAKTVEIRLKPVNNVPLAVFTLHLEGDRMVRVELPTGNRAGWRFVYGLEREQLCIKNVWTPLGAHETIQYNDAGHGFPGNTDYLKVPRVTDHITDPGDGQSPIVVTYQYSNNGNNFLGCNAAINWDESGEDNLYKVIGAYTYGSTEILMVNNAPVRSVNRTFNRFHLLTSEITTQGTHRQAVTTTYHANDTDTFDKQVPQCQLPAKVVTLWDLVGDPRQPREDTEFSEFDIHGNQTLSVQASGTREVTTWYPADDINDEKDDDKQIEGLKDPYGFVRHMRDKTVVPTSDTTLVPDVQPGAPTLRTHYRYIQQDPLSTGTKPWIALAEESLLQVTGETEKPLERTVYSYFDVPGTAFLHGQPKRLAVTLGVAPGYTTFTEYEYTRPDATFASFAGEAVLRTTQTLSTDFDAVTKDITEERSLINGEPVLTSDKDVKIRYTYDALGRVLTETVSPDKPESLATRTYTYGLIRPAGQGEEPVKGRASQEQENVKGVKTRTWLDGLGRAVEEERQDIDNGRDAYRSLYKASYDALGQMSTETEIDWLETKDLPLTSRFTYDLWGQQYSVTGPDGVTRYTDNNPLTFTTDEWTEGMGKTRTVTNRLEKPVTVERFALNGSTRISLHSYKYDGLARTVSERNAGNFETAYLYDAYDRLVETTLPDRNKVVREFAPHSRGDLPTLIRVNSTVLGTQAFDGLERMIESVTGGRLTRYEFEASQSQPDRVVRPSGDVIAYKYLPELTEEPIKRTTQPKAGALAVIDATYVYDKKNARLLESSEQGLALSRTYNSNGEVSSETRIHDDVTYQMAYVYSRMSRLIRYTDVLGQVQRYEYDNKGRLEWTALGETGKPGYIKTDFTYTPQGQTASIDTSDATAGQNLKITLEYDVLGRETGRVFDFGASKTRLSQTWNGLDQVTGRLLSEGADKGGPTLRDEEYEYESRGRLEFYACSGPQSPVDPYDKTLTQQMFFFDALDNLEEVQTRFVGGTNTALFYYENDDPAQLSRISNSHADYPAMAFSYDENGNLLEDEAGRRLAYDSLGRLESVSEMNGGSPKGYQYDSEDILSTVRGSSSDEQRFYKGDNLVNRIDGDQQSTFLRAGGVVLAEHQEGAVPKSLLLAVDHKNTVMSESAKGATNPVAYTAYGHPSAGQPVSSRLGYNGEFTEAQTGWQLLGKGYRAYNPVQMRFHSSDSLSPFGEGGVNAYSYVSGDPMGYSDPSGNVPFWKVMGMLMFSSGSSRSASGGATSSLARTTFAPDDLLANYTMSTAARPSASGGSGAAGASQSTMAQQASNGGKEAGRSTAVVPSGRNANRAPTQSSRTVAKSKTVKSVSFNENTDVVVFKEELPVDSGWKRASNVPTKGAVEPVALAVPSDPRPIATKQNTVRQPEKQSVRSQARNRTGAI
ncbi:sugar-binding protein [Pseudomonas sp. N3-W]|uniref:RHS repeat domain-containing protein n=1 Tax=Pseudomonas sp. N3-W TaxID=2975049 RepID=UPI00217EC2BE|nr:RHS repeat-associated core domain-containing protein [Pseudomonas sp. N3-W]UWF46972.1 sugar-binding protein [Pseudomonas sp. N3-W]